MANASKDAFNQFLSEVKAIEKRDSVLTSEQQIERLTKPGSTYLNLNPFEVLQIPIDAGKDVIKKKYRTFSILVHPDKNQEQEEKARVAFDAVSKAYKTLQDEDETKKTLQIIEEGKGLADKKLRDKRKEAKKLGKTIEEDKDIELMKKFVRNTTVKLFADYELRRKQLEKREAEERKRQRNDEIAEEESKKKEAKFKDAWEKTRTDRVDSWRNFKSGGSKTSKEKYQKTAFKPPSLKPEKR